MADYHKAPGQYVYDGILYPQAFDVNILDRIRNGTFQLHEDDVLISTYPKAGTSWLQGIVSLIYGAGDMDAVSKKTLDERVPFLELTGEGLNLDELEHTPPPRLLKTHLLARFFAKHTNMAAKKTKTIYGLRNPKDTLVSYYHFYRMNQGFGCFKGTWSEFFDLFKYDRLGLGNWFDMVLEWWEYRKQYNVHYVKYEDLQKDTSSAIQQIANFLGKTLTADQLSHVVELTTFKKMRKDRSEVTAFQSEISPFMRKGEVGDWCNYFTPEQNAYFDKLYEDKMAGTGLSFDFTL